MVGLKMDNLRLTSVQILKEVKWAKEPNYHHESIKYRERPKALGKTLGRAQTLMLYKPSLMRTEGHISNQKIFPNEHTFTAFSAFIIRISLSLCQNTDLIVEGEPDPVECSLLSDADPDPDSASATTLQWNVRKAPETITHLRVSKPLNYTRRSSLRPRRGRY